MEKTTSHWGVGVLGLETQARISKMGRGGVELKMAALVLKNR
jgi:hypothetical protein